MSVAVIDTPDNYHHLDHLIIFCDFFNAKLLIRDIENKLICKKYYPEFPIEEIISLDHVKNQVGYNYDYLIHSFFWPENFFRKYFQGYKIKSIFTPHGNSDKHCGCNWMTKFKDQEFCLIYGQNMLDFLKEEKVFLSKYALTGNLRYQYYLKHQNYFINNYQKPFQAKLNQNKKTILYAPTKKDESMLSSFNPNNLFFFEKLADEFNLIIKLHPHFIKNFPAVVYPFFEKIAQTAQIIEDSPLIYPLLSFCDALITDYSSIGYDFLTFDRPLFFLQTTKKDLRTTFLHNCGIILNQNSTDVIKIIKNGLENDLLAKKRKELYEYTFHFDSEISSILSSNGGSTKTAESS